jgi:hypothetical protein
MTNGKRFNLATVAYWVLGAAIAVACSSRATAPSDDGGEGGMGGEEGSMSGQAGDASRGSHTTGVAGMGGTEDPSSSSQGGVTSTTSAGGESGTTSAAGAAGEGGSPSMPTPTFCDGVALPPDVAPADFQCLDFDQGLPDAALWVPNLTNSGEVTLASDRASSLPHSMLASVPEAASFGEEARAHLEWSNLGGDTVASATLGFEMNPSAVGGVSDPWTGSVSFGCVDVGGLVACIHYTFGSDRAFADDYTGLFVEWRFLGGGPIAFDECELSQDFAVNVWNDFELRVESTGDIFVTVNGVLASDACSGSINGDTVADYAIGLESTSVTDLGWSLHFDNVTAATTRMP